jgi:hypothetical protein
MMTLTLDGLLAKTPDILKPVVEKYGASLAAMTAAEFLAWIELMLAGDVDAAWRALLAKMPNAALLQAWDDKNAEWDAANEKNVRRVALQKEATLFILKILLGAALSGLGF